MEARHADADAIMRDSFQHSPSRLHPPNPNHSRQRRTNWRNCLWSFWACVSRTWQVFQTILVLALIAAVVLLGVQVHALQLQIAVEDERVDSLQEQVANQHQNQQDLNERVEQEHSLTLYQMAGTFSLLTCLLTAFHIASHLSNFNEPVVQRKIIAILWMSPIYSLTSFFSLIFPAAGGYLTVVKDFYEAYTVYTFLSFLIAVLGRGSRDAAVQVLACHADHLKAPNRCLKSFYYPPPETSATAMANAVLMECQILAMQFVLVRPVTSIVSFVTETLNNGDSSSSSSEESSDPYAYFKSLNFVVAMITNVSVFFAFNGLLKFYHLVREDLKWCQPFNKFLSVKAIVFLTFWQGLAIAIVVSIHYDGANTTRNNNTRNNTNSMILSTKAPTTSALFSPMPTPLTPPSSSWTASPFATPSTLIATASPPIVPTPSPTAMDGDAGGESLSAPVSTPVLNDSSRYYRRRLSSKSNATTAAVSTPTSASSRTNTSSSTPPNDNNDGDKSSHERAFLIQNFLICLEMLFFSMAHYCVFPADEWKPDYRPQQHYAKPGLALKDFVKDFSYIMTSSSTARRAEYHRQGQESNLEASNHGVGRPPSSTVSLEHESTNGTELHEDESRGNDDGVVVEFADGDTNQDESEDVEVPPRPNGILS